MIKLKKRYFFIWVSIIALFIVGFKTDEQRLNNNFSIHQEFLVETPEMAQVANLGENAKALSYVKAPFIGKSFIGFKEALAYSESRGNYFVVNRFGYAGKYQFGASALRFYGIKNKTDFINSPELQEQVFELSLQRTKWVLRDEIRKYKGTMVGGVFITESGILAAAHLAGVGSVKRFFATNGKYRFNDAFGTSLRKYLRDFEGYDLSCIEENRDARFQVS